MERCSGACVHARMFVQLPELEANTYVHKETSVIGFLVARRGCRLMEVEAATASRLRTSPGVPLHAALQHRVSFHTCMPKGQCKHAGMVLYLILLLIPYCCSGCAGPLVAPPRRPAVNASHSRLKSVSARWLTTVQGGEVQAEAGTRSRLRRDTLVMADNASSIFQKQSVTVPRWGFVRVARRSHRWQPQDAAVCMLRRVCSVWVRQPKPIATWTFTLCNMWRMWYMWCSLFPGCWLCDPHVSCLGKGSWNALPSTRSPWAQSGPKHCVRT